MGLINSRQTGQKNSVSVYLDLDRYRELTRFKLILCTLQLKKQF